jgi:acyl-CoA dehydrogenase
MDFELTQRQKNIQWTATEFAKGEFDSNLSITLDQNREFPEAIWKKACQLGFIGVNYPKEFGGLGLGLLEKALVIEAFCKVDSGIGIALNTVDLGSAIILKFGSLGQKEQFVAPLAKGQKALSIAFAESEVGNDFSTISTVAERVGEEYILNGRKRFVFNALLADAFIILCKEPKEGWITLIMEKQEGAEIKRVEKMGMRMVQFGDLEFKEVRVPFGRRVGGEGEGLLQVNHFYEEMGIRSAAQALGISEGAFERATKYAKQREAFGKKLSQFQVIRHKLADIAVGIEVARWLIYKSATEYDQGRIKPDFLQITQLEVGRRLVRMVYDAQQIFGGAGYMAEMEIEHYYRDGVVSGVAMGTEEELKDAIAEKIVGPEA